MTPNQQLTDTDNVVPTKANAKVEENDVRREQKEISKITGVRTIEICGQYEILRNPDFVVKNMFKNAFNYVKIA